MATKYIILQAAIETVLEKPDMTPDEKATVVARLNAIMPSDVVEVVRCGECRERTSGRPFCQGRPKDWFCANGARWTK